ncbi:serine/threonine-protein kinase [Vigna angularis]|uniref:Serine/threonine-protein kinase n=1 Tax=Phaseolus angularis TaxID=3914 RepID=A0A8T0LBR1_PHAAN|nr:serine/threonine-protein kinase [Vigna angularis]
MEQASKKQISRSFRPLYFFFFFLLFSFLYVVTCAERIFLKHQVVTNYTFALFTGIYKPAEFWQLEDHIPQPTKRRHRSCVFTLKEMEEATCSFNDDNLLGKGGFGRVYRGNLKSGEVVAIKKMELPAMKAAEGEREFRVEISDFGLAKLMPEGQETHVTVRVFGTFGYFDPEYTSVRHLLKERKKLRKVIDAEMARNSYTIESIFMFANLASRCVHAESNERPSMVDCVKEIQMIIHTNSKGLGMVRHSFRMV